MLQEGKRTNVAKKLGISTLTLKNWIRLNNLEANEKRTTMQLNNVDEYSKKTAMNKKTSSNDDISNFRVTLDSKELPLNIEKDSYAHCLHQSIQTLADSLNKKLDALQDAQVDVQHIEIITDRVFHSIEKLKNEVRELSSCFHEIESKNRSLESKIDELNIQNEIVLQKCSHFELISERFFSKNTELENRLLAIEHKMRFSENKEKTEFVPKTKSTGELLENLTETQYYQSMRYNSYNTDIAEKEQISPTITQKELKEEAKNSEKSEENIETLINSKKEIEEYINKNFPREKLKRNNSKIFSWFQKIIG